MAFTPGARLGPYEIVALLGSGGMGEVYRAKDPRLARDVAIKVLPEAVARHPERLARFEREARTAATLNHPSIVTIYSIEEAGGVRFITMELVQGQGLDRLVAPGGLSLPRVLELAVALADALVAAHERGIVHRDLKPANVMVTRDGRPKVLDFGLARPADGDFGLEGTQAMTVQSPVSSVGQVVGTVPYMAPEQVRGEALDARADLFALGIILYELVAGRRPFGGTTPADVTSAILRDAPTPLASLRAELPRDLERIVARCLEKDRERRFQTAKDVRNELELVQREIASGSSSSPRAVSSTGSPPGAPVAAAPAREAPSIAVLPFVNRSRDADDEYFSDGLADELLNVLAKIRGLRVAARTSSSTFKGRQATIEEVGRALNVASVLEGSVRKSGTRVRISVQLVKVADGYHLWSETYDRTLDDIFAVQDDIAQAVVKELRTALLGEAPDSKGSGELKAEVASAAKGRGESTEAHRLYLQGRYLVDRLSREEVSRGIRCLLEAVTLDPGHALAWVCLSQAYGYEAGYGWAPMDEGYPRAIETVGRAIALEPDLPEAHSCLGRHRMNFLWDWAGADASYRRALELAPDSSDALRGAGALAQARGRYDEAIALSRRSVECDPLSMTAHVALGQALRGAGRAAEAEASFLKAIDLAPERIVVHLLLSLVLIDQGRAAEAIAAADREPAPWARLCALGIAHYAAGNRAEGDAALREMEEKFGGDSAYQIAAVHLARGDASASFEWLDRAYAQHDPGLVWVGSEPLFRPLHGDPRWRPFLGRMKIEP